VGKLLQTKFKGLFNLKFAQEEEKDILVHNKAKIK
jgi:hypothetical protein